MENVTEKNFDDTINSDELTIIDFSATWCMPCRMLKPILEKAEDKFENVYFYNLDIDESEQIAKRYRIFSVPTVVCFRSGKKIDSMVGLNSFDDVVSFIKRCENTKLED